MSTQPNTQKVQMPSQLAGLAALPAARLDVNIKVSTQINVTSFTAQRKVSKLVLDQVSHLLFGDTPNLVLSERACWRVPVKLAFPTTGPVGAVGEIDVDVQTGEVLADEVLLQEIENRAADLARRHTPEAI